MHGSVLENKSAFNIAGIAFLFLIVLELSIVFTAKSYFKKIGALNHSVKFLGLFFISKNLPNHLAYNTVVISGLGLSVANWICYI